MRRTLYVLGAVEAADKDKRHEAMLELMRKMLPDHEHECRTAAGPFEDDVRGLQMHFDQSLEGLRGPKLVLATKRDGLTSVVSLARHVQNFLPDLIVGEG